MSRLVEPISQEEYDKLPRWQKWINVHWGWVLGAFVILFVGSLILIKMGII